MAWDWSGVTSVKRQIVFQCASLISTSRTVGCVFSHLFKVDVRELRLTFMQGHWVIETHKVLVLNVRNCWVANKVMLGNVLDLYRSRKASHLVLGFVDGVGLDSLIHVFLLIVDFFSLIRSHHLLHDALQVNVNTAHILTLNCQTLFSRHCFKYAKLVFCAFNFFVLSNRLAHGRHHNNAVFVQQSILCPIPNDRV